MRAGQLNIRVDFQARSATRGAMGGESTNWTTSFSRWARMSGTGTRELYAAQSNRPEITHVVSVRYDPALADPVYVSALRLNYNGRIFDIKGSFDPEEQRKEIHLWCTEGKTNG